MVEAGVAIEITAPVWMDCNRNVVEEEFSYSFQVTHQVTIPEDYFSLDELGRNTSQKGDGYNGGQLFVCSKGKVPKLTINVQSKYYTFVGITAFTREIGMCVIIFAGLKPNALYKTGFDPFADMIGDWNNKAF